MNALTFLAALTISALILAFLVLACRWAWRNGMSSWWKEIVDAD